MSCYAQRMGGINSVVLSKDEGTIVSVGQERKLTFWNISTVEAMTSLKVSPNEDDEGTTIARSVRLCMNFYKISQ